MPAPTTPAPSNAHLASCASVDDDTRVPGSHVPRQLDDAGAEQLPPRLGRYRLLHRLGRGGMASVFRAHDPGIGRDVAIKVLHASLSADPECRERFLREARSAGALAHPHIVTVYDVGAVADRPFMAMELVTGCTLAEHLQRHGRLPARTVATLGLQLARALDYAHRAGIVHRDIKPGNILVLDDGSGVKVADFGIAQVDASLGGALTRVGAVIGTPQYMSPEQARGEPLDGRSDLFATGIVLYQALTGRRPFEGDNLLAVAQAIAHAEAPPLQALCPDVPAGLRRVIERCLARQPGQRWASGAELAAALRGVLDALDADETQQRQARGLPQPLRWALGSAAVMALVMAVAAAVVTLRQGDSLQSQARAYGHALATAFAAQNAAAVLADDWAVVEVAVRQVSQAAGLERLWVADHQGIVRAASTPGAIGQPWQRVAASAGAVPGPVVPVQFDGRTVGHVALAWPRAPLAAAVRQSASLLGLMALLGVLAVSTAVYAVARSGLRPLRQVHEALDELAQGHYGHRIAETRADDFGRLFQAVDRLALALQRRADGDTGTPAPLRLVETPAEP